MKTVCRCLLWLSLVLLLFTCAHSAVLRRTWTTQPWCESVRKPQWPFAYQKTPAQSLEWQGRVNPNDQDMRHECTVFGVQSKCHICQDFACNGKSGDSCAFQIQGVPWSALPTNIPTVSDVPWAVGGQHRYDYGSATHLCMFLSGGECLSPLTTDFSQCDVRCWGTQSGSLTPKGAHPMRNGSDSEASDIWSYSAAFGTDGQAQGRVMTVAGAGVAGYLDGPVQTAQFNYPRGVAVDSKGVVYVADTANHCIRVIDPATQMVSTLAGIGTQGFADGAALSAAQFSFPSDVAVLETNSGATITVFVADAGNHRIRQIKNGVVSCLSGLCGAGVETVRLSQQPEKPHAGLADGDRFGARFDSPMGIAVDANGAVFVADTGNHLIRRIEPDGTTHTLAGNVVPAEDADTPGCLSPCLRGDRGFRDGSLTYAQFNSPRGITLGPARTLVVADGHRVRRVTYDGGASSTIETVTSANRVVTLAGSNVPSHVDGEGDEATFQAPAGVAVAADGRVYAASSTDCTVRQISPASLVARSVTCSTRATQVLRPSGCASYEQPVDELFLQETPAANNIFHNYLQRDESDSVTGVAALGRTLKDCTGSPPADGLVQGDLALPLRDSNTQQIVSNVFEDLEYGTTIKVRCPASCASSTATKVFGTGLYSDVSSICVAAIHSGAIVAAQGGLITMTLERGTLSAAQASAAVGTTANGVTSLDLSTDQNDRARLFSVQTYLRPKLEVQSIAGAPSAPLGSQQDGCGYLDTQPPLAARFQGIAGLDIAKGRSLSRTDFLYIADAGNHRIRAVSATCAKVCENGGVCVAADVCTCMSGWTGDDCSIPVCSTTCGARQVCVGPNTCDCIPGYGGFPTCTSPQCVQKCQHGGVCSAPDTCTCTSGWFDANCTTPVCTQTCGNDGNCTAPDTCTCADAWKGTDCRVPVCTQTCQNGGSCIAPDSCLCAAGWSGFDCSLPICPQGDFVPHPSGYANALSRPLAVESYVPCDFARWCLETGEFDCLHRLYSTSSPVVDASSGLAAAGKQAPVFGNCRLIELADNALAHFQYYSERNETSGFYRFSPAQPYGWNADASWRGIASAEVGFSPPFLLTSDRQVALVERRRIVQGVYTCAHGGDCIAPDVCECASGWSGFDCRTPVCSQGYYSPNQTAYVAAEPPNATDPRQPVSNPTYNATVEQISYSTFQESTEVRGGERYKPAQGGYACSIRSITKWEKPATSDGSPAYYFNHPNYYSRYMDKELSADGHYHTNWTGMSWPPLYNLSVPPLDDTREGWKRGGVWSYIPGAAWQKGVCLLEFDRHCNSGELFQDRLTNKSGVLVVDTDASYRPQVIYSAEQAVRLGFWNSSVFGECVDRVVRGCFNNGTCAAPGVCECASGWTGKDCTTPLCTQTCHNGGNCTLPDMCTCALGWTGRDCSKALCAQECRNNGTCVAPDQCQCVTWNSRWRDGRENGGKPVFQLPDGEAQLTGYTGYDCNTPICVQAKRFVLNVASRSSSNFCALRGNYDSATAIRDCNTYRCPQYDQELTANDGLTFQSGCSVGDPEPNPTRNPTLTRDKQLQNLLDYHDELNTARTSDDFLCGNVIWEQGDIESANRTNRVIRTNYVNVTKVDEVTWEYGASTPGEGIYECFNSGACVAPDECACSDGWSGIDCNTPLCRFLEADTSGTVSYGCRNGGVCIDQDLCRCITVQSTLHEQYPTAPVGLTGYFGSDCALPICIQGVYDPICNASVVASNLNLTSGNITGIEATASSVVSSGDGCYRCKNGGLCVAPDMCACSEGWSGFDCSTPICELSKATTVSLRRTLFTVDELKVEKFRTDPCGTEGGRWGKEIVNGALVGQGNCTLPMKCTCLCRQRYDKKRCDDTGELCEKPWHDPFRRYRSIPQGYIYGTRDCVDGFQGLEDADGNFLTCHLQVYVPSLWRRYTVSVVVILTMLGILLLLAWYYIRKKVRRALLLAKAERRRSRKNSEENMMKPGAFAHPKNE